MSRLLDAITDVVLAYRPRGRKVKPVKRKRHKKNGGREHFHAQRSENPNR